MGLMMDMQAFDLIQQLCASQYLVRSLHVVAELAVADAIGDSARSVVDVAVHVGAAPGQVLKTQDSHTCTLPGRF